MGEGAETVGVVVVVAHRVAVERNAEFAHALDEVFSSKLVEMIGEVEIDAVQPLDLGGSFHQVERRRLAVTLRPIRALADAEGVAAARRTSERFPLDAARAKPP